MVQVANIIITKSLDVVNKLFFSEISQITSLSENTLALTEEELSESLIFGPGSPSKGLLSFKYSYGKAGENSVRVSFIETEELAEFLLLANDPMARLLESKISKNPELADAIEEAILNEKLTTSNNTSYADSEDILRNADKYYFAFGTSDDLREWAGPYSMSMLKATLKNTEDNVRSIEAVFVPNPNSHKAWSKHFEKLYGYSDIVNDYNDAVSRGSYVAAEGSIRMERDINSLDSGALNILVRDVVREYLYNACETKNVIVSFPNDVAYYQNEDNKIKYALDDGNRTYTAAGVASRIANNESLVRALGMQVSPFIDKDSGILAPNTGATATKYKKTSSIQATSEYTVKNLNIKEYDISLSMREPVGKSGRPKTPLLKPLYTFCAGVGAVSKDSLTQDFTLFEETDMRILKLWKKYGLIPDASKPALLFGDKESINRLLYLSWYNQKDKDLQPKSISLLNRDYLFSSGSNRARINRLVRQDEKNASFIFEAEKANNSEYRSYAEDFINDMSLDLKSDSIYFGNNEFSTGVTDLAESLRIKDLAKSDLIFRHNISLPNVLSLSYSVDSYYAALTSLNVFPKIPLDNINSTTRSAAKNILLKNLDYNFFWKFIDTIDPTSELSDSEFVIKMSSDTNIQKAILMSPSVIAAVTENSEFRDSVTDINIVAYVAFIRNIERTKRRGSLEQLGTTIISDTEKQNKVYEAIYDKLKGLMMTASIKTLPYFDKNLYMSKSCSLVGVNNSLIGAERNKRLAPYTGEYEVIGWTHVIEFDSIYSKFELVRSGSDGKTSDLTGESVKSRIITYLLAEKAELNKRGPKKGSLEEEYGLIEYLTGFFGDSTGDLSDDQRRLKEIDSILEKLGG